MLAHEPRRDSRKSFMKPMGWRVLLTGLRTRLLLVALLALLPLFVAAFYPALLQSHGRDTGTALHAGLVFALAALGMVLAALAADRLVLAPMRRLRQQASRLHGAASLEGDTAVNWPACPATWSWRPM